MDGTSFGGVRQLAMVVPDAEAAMLAWARIGVGPFFVIRSFEFGNYRYRGRRADPPVVSLCFGQAGPLQIEIIQQFNTAPSAYTEFLERGQQGCQHVAEWFDNSTRYDQRHADLAMRGFVCVHEGEGGAPRARFSYWDTGLPGGLMLELAEAELPGVRALPDMVANAAIGWDGTDPIRYL